MKKKPIVSNAIRNRPRIKVYSTLSPEIFMEHLKIHLQNHTETLKGNVNAEGAVIYLKIDEEKYWSPQLQVRAEKDEDDPQYTVIRGIFGPSSGVWTFFMFMYGLSGAMILTTGMYGISQWFLGISDIWVWTNVLGVLLIVSTYLAAQFGKRLSRKHMEVLYTFIETILVKENVWEKIEDDED